MNAQKESETIVSHYPVSLPRPSKAYVLKTPGAEIAVVFVHGFDGDARSTWIDFQHLVDHHQKSDLWSKSDLYFYSYISHDQIKPLGEELLTFLHDVVLTGGLGEGVRPRFVFPSGFSFGAQTGTPARYKHIVLVGHSTGAVLIRRAVIEELMSLEDSGELQKWSGGGRDIPPSLIIASSLRFFAPAHRGVLGAGWLGLALSLSILNLIAAIKLHMNPLFKSLTAGGPALEDLKTTTERFHDKYPNTPALIAHSIFGDKDAVVVMGGYKDDKEHITAPGQTHTSICKPSVSFALPLEFVTDGLFGSAARK